jgi:RNA polymerase sigma factor (TIGR02999 family)
VIRNVIIDIVRHEQAEKRGGGSFDTLDTHAMNSLADDRADVLAVAEALEALSDVDPRLASVVEMRYFAGFSEAEIAQALNLSERTVRRDWDKARAFLMVALQS